MIDRKHINTAMPEKLYNYVTLRANRSGGSRGAAIRGMIIEAMSKETKSEQMELQFSQ